MSSDAVRAITSNTLFWTNKSQVKNIKKSKKNVRSLESRIAAS
jgi:hypothetical protein